MSDFRKEETDPDAIIIKEIEVERVETFKQLIVVLDNKLTWKNDTDVIVKKTKKRIYCLRKLRSSNINQNLLQIFYSSMICSVLSFALICWRGSIQKQERDRLDKIVRKTGGMISKIQDDKQNVRNHKRSHASSA